MILLFRALDLRHTQELEDLKNSDRVRETLAIELSRCRYPSLAFNASAVECSMLDGISLSQLWAPSSPSPAVMVQIFYHLTVTPAVPGTAFLCHWLIPHPYFMTHSAPYAGSPGNGQHGGPLLKTAR